MTTTIWVPWQKSGAFLDSSALMQRYVIDTGNDLVDAILEPEGPHVLMSWLAVVEIVAALRRRVVVERDLSSVEADRRIQLLGDDMNQPGHTAAPVDAATSEQARRLLLIAELSASDAIQLASALRFQERGPEMPVVYVTAQDRVAELADRWGLYPYNVLRPVQPQIRGVRARPQSLL